MIDEVITFLPEIKEKAGEAVWLEALKSLRGITEGKVRPAGADRARGSYSALGALTDEPPPRHLPARSTWSCSAHA
jgi:hypothetical protein